MHGVTCNSVCVCVVRGEGLETILDAGVDGAAVAGEELGGVGAGGVFDHTGRGGVGFVGEVARLDEPRDAFVETTAELEAEERVGVGRESVAVVDVGFDGNPLEGRTDIPARRGFPDEFAAHDMPGQAGDGVVAIGGVVVETEPAPRPGRAQHEAVNVGGFPIVPEQVGVETEFNALVNRAVGIDRASGADGGGGRKLHGEQLVFDRRMVGGGIPAQPAARAPGADLDGRGGLRVVGDDGGAGFAEGRWLVAAAHVGVELRVFGGIVPAHTDLRSEVVVVVIVGVGRSDRAERPRCVAAVVRNGEPEHAGESAAERKLAFGERLQVRRSLVVLGDERTARAGDVDVVGGGGLSLVG